MLLDVFNLEKVLLGDDCGGPQKQVKPLLLGFLFIVFFIKWAILYLSQKNSLFLESLDLDPVFCYKALIWFVSFFNLGYAISRMKKDEQQGSSVGMCQKK